MSALTFDDVLQQIKAEGESEQKTVEAAEMVSEIIEKLVKTRIGQGISQRELAQRTGIQQPTIARMEKVKVIPRLDTIARIAVCLGVEIAAEEKTVTEYSPTSAVTALYPYYSTRNTWNKSGYRPGVAAAAAMN